MSKVVIRVDNCVRLSKRGLLEEDIDALKRAFTFDNPDYTMKRLMKIPGWWHEPKETGTWFENKKTMVFPRGCLRRVRDLLEGRDVAYRLIDARTEGGACLKFPDYIGWELRYFQEEAIAEAMRLQNCVVRLPTGSGKSLMAIALSNRIGLNTLVILPTVGLFDQWCQDARDSLKLSKDGLGIIHQKKRVLRPITAAVQGTLASRGIDDEMKEYFGVVIVDECQKAAAASYVKVVDPFPAKYRIGISADERRKDRKDYLTNGLFGSVAYEKKRKELEDEGFIVDVEIRVVPTEFQADWYGLSKHKDDEREVDFDRLLAEMTSDEARNKLALKFAFQEADDGQQVILLSHRVEHCQRLERAFVQRGVPSGFFLGGAEHHREFEATRAGIKDGSIRVGVGTYQALGIGVNLPAVGAGVATTPIGGNKFNFNQVRGRLNRKSKDKTKACMYWLWDRHVYPSHLKNVIAWNPTVRVFENGRWVDAKAYLKRQSRWKVKK